MKRKVDKLFDKLLKDKHGHIVIFQSPNLSELAFFLFTILSLLFRNGEINNLFKVLAFGCLFTWSWLELFQGVNYFRRLLGLVILIGSSSSFIQFLKYTNHL